jgi:hypothetical protein
MIVNGHEGLEAARARIGDIGSEGTPEGDVEIGDPQLGAHTPGVAPEMDVSLATIDESLTGRGR